MGYLLKNSSQVVAALERTAHNIKEDVNIKFKLLGYGVSYEQWVVLNAIFDNEGATQIQIARDCNKEPASICRTLQFLLKKELISKSSDINNKKIKRVELTLKGRTLVENARRSVEEVSQKCLENIFDRELNLFINILDRIQQQKGIA